MLLFYPFFKEFNLLHKQNEDMIIMNLNIIRENVSCGMMGSIAVVTGDGTNIEFMDIAVNPNQWKIGTYIFITIQHFLIVVLY